MRGEGKCLWKGKKAIPPKKPRDLQAKRKIGEGKREEKEVDQDWG